MKLPHKALVQLNSFKKNGEEGRNLCSNKFLSSIEKIQIKRQWGADHALCLLAFSLQRVMKSWIQLLVLEGGGFFSVTMKFLRPQKPSLLDGVGGIKINIFWSLLPPRLLQCFEGCFIASGWQAPVNCGVGKCILDSSVIDNQVRAMVVTASSCPIYSRDGRILLLLRGKSLAQHLWSVGKGCCKLVPLLV